MVIFRIWTRNYTLEWFSEAESAPIPSAVKFCFDIDVRIFFNSEKKIDRSQKNLKFSRNFGKSKKKSIWFWIENFYMIFHWFFFTFSEISRKFSDFFWAIVFLFFFRSWIFFEYSFDAEKAYLSIGDGFRAIWAKWPLWRGLTWKNPVKCQGMTFIQSGLHITVYFFEASIRYSH